MFSEFKTFKKNTNNYSNYSNEDKNKILNIQENACLNLMRTMQDMNIKFKQEIERVKRTQTEMKKKMKQLLSLIKTSVAILTTRMDYKDGIPVPEDRVEELPHLIK